MRSKSQYYEIVGRQEPYSAVALGWRELQLRLNILEKWIVGTLLLTLNGLYHKWNSIFANGLAEQTHHWKDYKEVILTFYLNILTFYFIILTFYPMI